MAVNRHDLSVIKVFDPREQTLPDVGIVNVKDSESGVAEWVNTSSRRTRDAYSAWWQSAEREQTRLLNRYSIDNVSISTCDDYVKGLLKLFHSAK